MNLNHVAVYFDLSANSYLAVVRVLDIAQRTGATLSLRPVSPTLFQELTHAPPPPVFTGNKAAVLKADFDRYAARWNLILKEIVNAEATEKALRVIQATQESARPRLVMAILQGFHTGIADIEDVETLKRMAYGILDADQVGKAVESDSIAHGELDRTTEELATHFGALGVPAFWVPDPKLKPELKGVGFADGGQIHMGHDRLHFVESQLRLNADPSSTTPVPMPRIALGPLKNHTTLTFWFDFSSPWTYLGYTQLKRIMAEAGPYLKVILKPTLLGIVFKSIGTPVVPTAVATKARQEWQQVELKRWADYWSAKPFKGGKAVRFKWSDHFPLRTPLALRMVCGAISKGWKEEELFKLCDTIFAACWADNIPIADKPPASQPLLDYLSQHGYDSTLLASDTFGNSKEADAMLRKNTQGAVDSGVCGFPTFQIGGDLVWGQDRLDVVGDLLFGWDWRDEKHISRPRL